jgi:predicted ATP-dependent serine protease
LRAELSILATVPNGVLVTETSLETILDHTALVKPDLLIVDSIQTVYLPELESAAGSVSQVRECASRLRELAKSSGLTVFLIGLPPLERAGAGPPAAATSPTGSRTIYPGPLEITRPKLLAAVPSVTVSPRRNRL